MEEIPQNILISMAPNILSTFSAILIKIHLKIYSNAIHLIGNVLILRTKKLLKRLRLSYFIVFLNTFPALLTFTRKE